MANVLACLFFALLGFMGGATSVFFALEARRKAVEAQKRLLDAKSASLNTARADFETQAASWTANANAQYQAAKSQFENQSAAWVADQNARWKAALAEVEGETARVKYARMEIEARIVSYKELQDENSRAIASNSALVLQ